jgi:pimeloyl-ACP methyl ester carboxylesterase
MSTASSSIAAQNSAFVLIPGSFSSASVYHKVTAQLASRGYEVHETELLSASKQRDVGPATMAEDAAHIADVISRLVNQGKRVVLGMNSYGGFPGTEAAKGMSKAERQQNDSSGSGAVVGLVYIASFIPPVGMSLRMMLSKIQPDIFQDAVSSECQFPFCSSLNASDRPPIENGSLTMVDSSIQPDYMNLNPSINHKTIFSDLPEDEAKYYMDQMSIHSTISFSGRLTHPAYKHVPVTYLLTAADKMFLPEYQRATIDAAERDGIVVRTVELDSGHTPMLSMPDEVVQVLLEAAAEI